MKFFGAFVVLTLATLFYNIEGLVLDNEENNFDSIKTRAGWNNLNAKNTLRSAGIGRSARLRAIGGTGEGRAGDADPTDDDTDLLEQWCEDPYELQDDPMRWLLCTLRDAFNSDDDSEDDDSEESASSTETNRSNSNSTESNSGTSGDTTNNDRSIARIAARSNINESEDTTSDSTNDNGETEAGQA